MRMVLTLAVALLIAGPVLAGPKKHDGKKCDKDAASPATKMVDQITKGLTLTDDQKTKLDDIKKEFDPKLAAAVKAQDVLTPEQKQAGKDAAKAAKADGKKGKDLKQAVEEATKATAEQKTKMSDAAKDVKSLHKDLREKVLALLTPDQKEQLKPKSKPKKDKKEKEQK